MQVRYGSIFKVDLNSWYCLNFLLFFKSQCQFWVAMSLSHLNIISGRSVDVLMYNPLVANICFQSCIYTHIVIYIRSVTKLKYGKSQFDKLLGRSSDVFQAPLSVGLERLRALVSELCYSFILLLRITGKPAIVDSPKYGHSTINITSLYMKDVTCIRYQYNSYNTF